MEKCKSLLRHLFLLLMLLTGIQCLSAQQISVTGTVTDPSGEPLSE